MLILLNETCEVNSELLKPGRFLGSLLCEHTSLQLGAAPRSITTSALIIVTLRLRDARSMPRVMEALE